MRISHTRRNLLLSTVLAASSLVGYSRNAEAACVVTLPATYDCSSANSTTQSILNVTDAKVFTSPGFSVNAAAGNGVEVSGDGAIVFGDIYGSYIKGANYGLAISNLIAGVGSVYAFTSGSVTGGVSGIVVGNNSTGFLTIVAAGDVTGAAIFGIYGENLGTDLSITTGGTTKGGTYGILAYNNGIGFTDILVNGDVTGSADSGIKAKNDGTNLTIKSGLGTTVLGEKYGIHAQNFGSLALDITTLGNVTGTTQDGINADNFGTSLSITTGVGTLVKGFDNGIGAYNRGAGTLDIIANGDVTSRNGDGIKTRSLVNGTGITVTTGASTKIIGAYYGIYADNQVAGAITIAVNGDVTGTGNGGIGAFNTMLGTDITVTAAANTMIVGDDGIKAHNHGAGTLLVTADGIVTATNGDGIDARNFLNATDLILTTGIASNITAASTGIYASSKSGTMAVTTNGQVTATGGDGLYVSTVGVASSALVTTGATSAVTGSVNGIHVKNYGVGSADITVNGDVVGLAMNGIFLETAATSASASITTGIGSTVIGLDHGIYTIRKSLSPFNITVRGTVTNSQADNYANFAIYDFGDAATIDNQGTGHIIGKIYTFAGNDNFINSGSWGSTGTSDFGAGTNTIVNNGFVVAAHAAGVAESTTFANAGTFTNSGLIAMMDEVTGNGSQVHDTLTIDGDFVGGGALFVDAFLGAPGSTADLLTINGNVTGVTQMAVRNTNAGLGAANSTGIAVVQVNGATAAGDFVLLGGPISAGLFVYDLAFDVANSVHELVSTGASSGGFELASLTSGAQSIWYDTAGVMDEHFSDLHKDMRSAVMDDGSQAHAAAHVAGPDKGLWGKIIGRTSERDVSSTLSYGLDTTGILVGLDGQMDTREGTLVLGLMGGYVNASQNFNSGSNGDYEGFTTGLYASYVNGGFHTNAQFKADFLNLDYVMAGTAGTTNADVTNLGGSIESGYRFDLSNQFYAEPVVQLAYVTTDIRNGAVLGTAFSGDGTSLRGAVGLNFGGQIGEASSGMVFKPELSLKLWNEFNGSNTATFSGLTVTDNTPNLFGAVGLGLEAINFNNGWSGTLKGDVQFAKDFSSLGGFVGLRKEF